MKEKIKNRTKILFNKIDNCKYFGFIGIILYKIILDFAYMVFIQPYVKEWYKIDFNIYKFILGYILVILLYVIINRLNGKLSKFMVKLLFCLMFIPISTIYAGKNFSTINFLLFFMEFIIIIFTIKILEYMEEKKKKNRIVNDDGKTKDNKFIKITTKVIYYGFIINTIFVLLACFYYNGLPSLTALNLEEVYEVRESFYLPKLINYLYNFEITFILTFLIVLYIHKRSYIKLTLSIIALLVTYLYKGDKMTLLSLFLVVGVYFIFRLFEKHKKLDKLDNYIAPALAIMIVFSILTYKIYNMFYAVLVTRLLITPANLKFWHMNFFAHNPKIGIVGTLLNAIIKFPDPYAEIPYQNLISGLYTGNYETYANTGFLSEGFARFGYIGLIILPIILGLIIYFINNKGLKKGELCFIAGISIYPLMNLNDGYLLGSLMFGAILLLVIVVLFFDTNYVCENKKNIRLFNKSRNLENKEEL